VKLKVNDVVTTEDGTRQFIVMKDTTDECSLVELQTQVLSGTTVTWVTTRAPIADLIKVK
jgi:hypothetical protein